MPYKCEELKDCSPDSVCDILILTEGRLRKLDEGKKANKGYMFYFKNFRMQIQEFNEYLRPFYSLSGFHTVLALLHKIEYRPGWKELALLV